VGERPSDTRAENDATPHIHVRQRVLTRVNADHRTPTRPAAATPAPATSTRPASPDQPRPSPLDPSPGCPGASAPHTLPPPHRRQQHTVRTTVLGPEASRRLRALIGPGACRRCRETQVHVGTGLTARHGQTRSASWASTCAGRFREEGFLDGPARTRTWARRIMSPLLYRLSYRAAIEREGAIGRDASTRCGPGRGRSRRGPVGSRTRC
jgi:hypothetical protein